MMTLRSVFAAALVGAGVCSVCAAQPPSSTLQPPRPPTNPSGLVGKPGQIVKPTPPPPVASPLDVNLDVGAAIEAAKKQAEAKGGRVLVVWAADPEAMMTKSLVEATQTEDVRKLLGLEFAVVWAEIGKSEQAAKTRELAKTLGAEVKATDKHATMTVLDVVGKPLGSETVAVMEDATRPGAYSVLKIQDFLIPLRAAAPEAKATVAGAAAKAKESGKGVLVVFGEWGNLWTGRFRAWLAQPEVAKAMAPSIVVVHVELLRDKGAFEVMESMGGVKVQSLPWFAVLGRDGKVAGLSQTEKTPNIGFPTDDVEIGMFLDLLRKGNPGLSEADAKALRESLVAYRQLKLK